MAGATVSLMLCSASVVKLKEAPLSPKAHGTTHLFHTGKKIFYPSKALKLGRYHSFRLFRNMPCTLISSSVRSNVFLEEVQDIRSALVPHWTEQAHLSSEL